MTTDDILDDNATWPGLGSPTGPTKIPVRWVYRPDLGYAVPVAFRARISTPVTGGTVTVVAVRPEEQKGWSRRPS